MHAPGNFYTTIFIARQVIYNEGKRLLERPTHSSADLGFTAILSSTFFFFFRQLSSKLTERNSVKIGHMFRSECGLKRHVQNLGCPIFKIAGPKPPIFDVFRRLRNLTATVTAYIFGTKHDIDNQKTAL